MSTVIADTVVMVVFGILLGTILKLYGTITDATGRTSGPAAGRTRRSFRERLGEVFDREKMRAENDALLKSMPRSGWLAMATLYGLVAMLIVVVKVSPVTMRWWPFLGSVLGSFMLAGFVFSRAAAASRPRAAADGG